MALRTIVTIADDPTSVLHKKTREVTNFDEKISSLAEDMLETMHHSNGVGLAAPQIGLLKRMFVMNVDDEDGDMVIINPEISEEEGESLSYEGCLSIPEQYGIVKRPQKLKLKYQDINGEAKELIAEDLKARCICHETDHLNGILFTSIMIGDLVHESQLNGSEEENNSDEE